MKEVALEFRDVSISLGETVSIRDFSLTAFRGEYVVVLGPDGSGKHLLIQALEGKSALDRGEILLEGKRYRPSGICQAHRNMVFVVSQNSNLIDTQTIAENMFCNVGKRRALHLVNDRLIYAETNRILSEFGLQIDAGMSVSTLTVSMKCTLEIIKWYAQGARILVLNNVLALSDPQECVLLLEVIRKVCAAGVTVLHFANRMLHESQTVDRCALMSIHGHIMRMLFKDDFCQSTINEWLSPPRAAEIRSRAPASGGRELLRADNVSVGDAHGLSFTLHDGETMGFLCSTVNKRKTIADALGGTCAYTGDFYIDGRLVRIQSEADAFRLGIGVLPSDSKRSYCSGLSLEENILLPFLNRISNPIGIINSGKTRALMKDAQENLNKLQKLFQPGASEEYMISVLSKCLMFPYRILIMPYPFAYNDLRKQDMIQYLANMTSEKGCGLIVIAMQRYRLESFGCDNIMDLN